VTKDCVVKLADFGVTTQLSYERRVATSYAGTPHFMAPEVIERQPYNSKARTHRQAAPRPPAPTP
jgi:serine/threonine protein kinase